MDDIEINLMENTIYEVIITSFNKQVNFKPFGIKFNNKKVILNLYPNRTLKNIKTNPEFLIQFTTNPLVYTKALLNKLTPSDYNKEYFLLDSNIVIKANVYSICEYVHEDNYGKVTLTQITANIGEIHEINNQPPVINRATNKIIDLLVDYTRIPYMNSTQKNDYINKLQNLSSVIKKSGNNQHIQSLKLLKKEIIEE